MSPPGKNSGDTTWLSVAITIRPAGTAKRAWSFACAQPLVVEGAEEQLVDQLRHRATAAAMRHVDAAVLEIDGADVVVRASRHSAIAVDAATGRSPRP